MRQMQKMLLACLLLIIPGFFYPLSGQTTNVSGVINQYFSVTAIDASNESLTLSTSAASFNTNDEILIIQMQGGTMENADNANFGNVTSIGGTGLYERATICGNTGNEISLQHTLSQSFDDPAASNAVIQVIKFSSYVDVNVNGSLFAPAWNGATGGVLVLSASGTISLNADINLNGLGFRGAATETMNSGCAGMPFFSFDQYFYAQADQGGAKKGEGIIPYEANKDYGKGAQANGGGGGNEHNAGGAGGANYGNGGQGGEKTTGGSFTCYGNHPGVGGKNLQTFINASNMMSLGGGGGAGNDNDGESQDAAPGGGIAIILADQIEGNGFSISARGENAAAAAGDAGSGGGAGGSILLSTNGFGATNLNLDVSGGQGGNAGIAANCLGPGGGGGGGLIRTATALSVNVISNVAGGASGVINASVTLACAGSQSSATDGQAGAVVNVALLPQSSTASSCVLAARPRIEELEESEILDIQVYPNPVNRGNEIEILLESEKDIWGYVDLLDLKGSKILQQNFEKNVGKTRLAFPTHELPKGIYQLRIILNARLYTSRLIIQ
ncbi:MAG: T9SS type A sorting domain-containing protein [Bacteroidia bacterium]|nr:T9SS type A sorting domain-containing protein [Bacteroidia bacterium]